jgi:hypothetical protein
MQAKKTELFSFPTRAPASDFHEAKESFLLLIATTRQATYVPDL